MEKFRGGEVVKCVDPKTNLTEHKHYTVVEHYSGYVRVINDLGREESFFHYRFKSIEKEINMKQNIQNREFIVGSIGPAGLSFSNQPKSHPTETQAKNEAHRLAKEFPGKTFIWVQFKGGALVNAVETF